MADIFGYERKGASGIFVADRASLKISGKGGIGGGSDLIQNWSVSYQQTLHPIYECGSANLYWGKSNPVGQGFIGRIVGKTLTTASSSLCDTGATFTINAGSGMCGDGASAYLSCASSVVTSVGFQGQAGQAFISQNVQFQFASLSVGSYDT